MNGRENGDRRRRDVELAAVTAFVPVLAVVPVWLLAIVVIWWPISLVSSITYWQVALIHLAVGSVLFIPAAQRQLLTRMIGARKPTVDEAPKLQRAFNEVVQAWHLRKHNFAVGVVDDDDLNAFACGGHLVVVTSYAIETLPRDELSGVLAHELSHHLGLHTVALTVVQWLTIPMLVLARVGFFLLNVATAATTSFGRTSSAVTVIGRLVATVLTLVSAVFFVGLRLTNALTNRVSRASELKADERVVQMGFGRPQIGRAHV